MGGLFGRAFYIHMKEEMLFYCRFRQDQFNYFPGNWADCESPLESEVLDEGIEFKVVVIFARFSSFNQGQKTKRWSTKKQSCHHLHNDMAR